MRLIRSVIERMFEMYECSKVYYVIQTKPFLSIEISKIHLFRDFENYILSVIANLKKKNEMHTWVELF